jgi:hypothetical protein
LVHSAGARLLKFVTKLAASSRSMCRSAQETTAQWNDYVEVMKGNTLGRHRIALVAGVVVAVLIAGVAYIAFIYQPILSLGGFGFGPNSDSGQMMRSYNTDVTMRNSGWSSVTITAIGRASSEYRTSQWRASEVKLCTVRYLGNVMCNGSEATGNPGSGTVPFREFTIPTNKTYDLLWRITYECGHVTSDVQFSVPLSIHYLWIFSRTVTLATTTFAPDCVN